MRYLLIAGLCSLSFLQSCGNVDPDSSRVKSGFTSADCNSLKRQYEFQSQKIPKLVAQFNELYSQSQTSSVDSSDKTADSANNSGSSFLTGPSTGSSRALLVPSMPTLAGGSIKSIKDCSILPMTDSEAYGACREVFLVHKAAKDAADAYNDPERPDSCVEGAVQKVEPHLFAYCDNQCSFGDANCTACSFSYKNSLGSSETAKMVCATKSSTMEAIETFCQTTGGGRCPVLSCNTDKGRFFSQSGASGEVVSGSNRSTESLELSAFLGRYATVDISAGVKAEASVSTTSKVSGVLRIVTSNSNQQISEGSGLYSAGTQARCEVEISALDDIEISGKVGVEGNFKLFGNGIKAGAGISAGGTVKLTTALLKSSSVIPAGGQNKSIILGQCREYIRSWLVRDLIEHIKNYEDFRVVREAVEKGSGKLGPEYLAESAQSQGEAAASSVYRRLGWVGYYKACTRASTFGAWTGASSYGKAACEQDSKNSPSNHASVFYDACVARLDKICRGDVSP